MGNPLTAWEILQQIAGFLIPSALLYHPPETCGALDEMLSLLAYIINTWKSLFLNVLQKPFLSTIKCLKLTNFFLYFDAHQIWTCLYLL